MGAQYGGLQLRATGCRAGAKGLREQFQWIIPIQIVFNWEEHIKKERLSKVLSVKERSTKGLLKDEVRSSLDLLRVFPMVF